MAKLSLREPVERVINLSAFDRSLAEQLAELDSPSIDSPHYFLLCHGAVSQSVYMGTHLLDYLYSLPSAQTPGNQADLVPIMLYRNILDIGDSIASLLRMEASSTAQILLRSLFETLLSLKFVLYENRIHQDRARAYLAGTYIQRYRDYLRYDPSTEQGKAFQATLDKDSRLADANFPQQNFAAERQIMEAILTRPEYLPYWEEYQKIKTHPKRRYKKWYQLCSSAASLDKLAEEVGELSHYSLVYSSLSEKTHGENVFKEVIFGGPSGQVHIHALRGPSASVKQVAVGTTLLLFSAHEIIRQTFLDTNSKTTKNYLDWYSSYRDFFPWLRGIEQGPITNRPCP